MRTTTCCTMIVMTKRNEEKEKKRGKMGKNRNSKRHTHTHTINPSASKTMAKFLFVQAKQQRLNNKWAHEMRLGNWFISCASIRYNISLYFEPLSLQNAIPISSYSIDGVSLSSSFFRQRLRCHPRSTIIVAGIFVYVISYHELCMDFLLRFNQFDNYRMMFFKSLRVKVM